MGKHTPTPWRCTKGILGMIVKGGDRMIARTPVTGKTNEVLPEDRANAEEIVRRVNAFDDMLASLIEIAEFKAADWAFQHGEGGRAIRRRMKEAIAKAEDRE